MSGIAHYTDAPKPSLEVFVGNEGGEWIAKHLTIWVCSFFFPREEGEVEVKRGRSWRGRRGSGVWGLREEME